MKKNKKSFSAEILAKPARDWSDSEIKKASVLPDIAKDKRDWTLFDIASSIGGNTPMKQDPAKTKALRLLDDTKQNISADATKEESGLESANLEVLPLGKMAKETGSAVLAGTQYLGSKTPILGRFVKSPVLPDPNAIKNTAEVLERSVVPIGTSTLVSGGNKLAVLADEAAKIARSPITETSKMELQILLDRIPRMANGKYGDTEQAIVDGIVQLLSK